MKVSTALPLSLLLASILIALQACAPKLAIPYSRTGKVEHLESVDNTITVRAHAMAGSKEMAVRYAERNALENILFRGIPGSRQESPLIADERAAYDTHGEALNYMTARGNFQQFVINSYIEQSVSNTRGVQVDQVIKFDLNALRKHLEREGIIRKFGL